MLPLVGIGSSGLSFLAIILLCPLLHLLMMRGAGGHDHAVSGSPGPHKAETADGQPISEGEGMK